MSDFFRPTTWPTSKKVRRCEACGALIPAGEKHAYQSGVYDGQGFVQRFHAECEAAVSKDAAEDGPDFCFTTGEYEPPARLKGPNP